MFGVGDVISYLDMCRFEGVNLQRGMNFHLNGNISVLLMSTRAGAPYADRVQDDGATLIYEGHDAPRTKGSGDPKTFDQPMHNPGGSLTPNGLFYKAAEVYRNSGLGPEVVRVYEKIRSGIWVFNGIFELTNAWREDSGGRKVFKFELRATNDDLVAAARNPSVDKSRIIPTSVKREVWKRDKGQCTKCGSKDNLHFDHIIPYSKGGSSSSVENIQLLCARHNLEKRDQIE